MLIFNYKTSNSKNKNKKKIKIYLTTKNQIITLKMAIKKSN